jgi:hypothetical protein
VTKLEVAARAMLLRQTQNSLNPVTWDQLGEKSRHGYLEDARVAFEAVERFEYVGSK